ncbi:MAG TPA: SRPBCC family protein [Myxococcota bacterium]|nr:SRPBCC family protein [Myxococcota bacterium]
MAEAEYVTTARIPREAIWDFVKDIDNFAPFFMGYQLHAQQSETKSTWVLKGDLGAMTRMLKFRVTITEWNGPDVVRFEIQGLNEAMTGEGSFRMQPYEDAGDAAAAEAAAPSEAKGPIARLFAAIFRFFFQLFRGKPQRAATADAGPAAGTTRIEFRLRVDPGGPMAPMINAMIKPLMPSFAEDFAGKLVGHLEARQGPR